MNFNNFQVCNASHRSQLQFCCYKINKAFCTTCWYTEGHFMVCNHSKCGHIQKMAHKVIATTLQIKVMQFLAQISPNFEVYDRFHKRFMTFGHMVSRKLKTQIQNKLPVFVWTALSEMLVSKCPKLNGLVYDELIGFDMLKIIKSTQQLRSKQLQEVIANLQKVSQQYDSVSDKLKKKQYTGTFEKQIQGISTFLSKQGNQLINGLNQSIKKHMQHQFGKVLKQFNPAIQFDGVKFVNKKNFDNIQCYNIPSLYSTLNPQQQAVGNTYHGISLNIQKLQQTPELLLEVGKSILKQKIYKIYNQIDQLKSSYPYKYSYIICTTLQADPQYELSVLSLQKLNIKNYQKKSQYYFLNSVNLIIMGPELITVQFKNYPKKLAQICIFGAVQSRTSHYNQIIQNQIGLSKQKIQKKINKFPFETKLPAVQLAYIQFQLAYEHLFTIKQNRAQFEGEKYALGRGIKLFSDIVKTWKQNGTIQFEIQKKRSEYYPLFI